MVNTEIRLIIFAAEDGETLYSQQKQDRELTVAKIMASGPITSWQIDGETVTGFIFEGLQNHFGQC